VKVIVGLGVHVTPLHLGEHPPAQLGSVAHHLVSIRAVSLRVRVRVRVRVVRAVVSSDKEERKVLTVGDEATMVPASARA
jgi:hypothetical protein